MEGSIKKKLDPNAHVGEYNEGAQAFLDEGEKLSTWIYLGGPVIDRFATALPNKENAKVWVQGSGNGRDAKRLVANGINPANITGVEISPVEIENAKRALPEATFIEGNIATAELPDSSMDAATQHMVSEHLDDETLAAVNQKTFQVLKPGGRYLVIGTHPGKTAISSGLSESGSFMTTFPWGGEGLNYHRTQEDFIKAYEDAGFIIDSVEELNLPEEAMETHPEDFEHYKKYPYLRLALTMHKPE